MNLIILLISVITVSCDPDNETLPTRNPNVIDSTGTILEKDSIDYTNVKGCDGKTYNNPFTSPYILPFARGASFKTGLTNCSSSYHGSGQPDQYAYDFNMPEKTAFIASRGGKVVKVVNDQSSAGGGAGNYVYIDHQDGTFGLYYHSPQNGIKVKEGDVINQGDVLGITGKSGLAGYPHLHFIVVSGVPNWPYSGIPVSFINASPMDVPLKGNTTYTALKQ